MIDARGLSCPMPVIQVQNAVKKDAPASLEVMVDNKVAVENITRYANGQGYEVTVEEQQDEFLLKLKK